MPSAVIKKGTDAGYHLQKDRCGILEVLLTDNQLRARSFFMESCGPGTEILVPMLTFVHDGRGTSINVLPHPFLRDACSSSFTGSKHNLLYYTGDLASFWTTSVIASVPLLHT
ncbi:hypothetical protein DAPPUDRAFT_241370 [Daphnia pulex]|uniref:Uncharacterized protein n=1 Tax=Daphnia pulex TaxID=6669 RepID=E9GE36_DAPPU|nr:hypothetical protein DAPPUDRAFT_241370 [Daphnia pulex]|eukprot:EFX82201.1 hypothetical protein DAPPUDRAFT_241370 [Daphnia pulex]